MKNKPERDAKARAFINSMRDSGWISLNGWKGGGHVFEMLMKNARCIIVQIYPDGEGFNVWRPITESMDIAETLAAVEAYGDPKAERTPGTANESDPSHSGTPEAK